MGQRVKILFIQHGAKKSGSVRSLCNLINGWTQKGNPADVLFLRKGPAMEIFERSQAKIINGRFLLAFHGSEVSGMSLVLALRNILSIPCAIYASLFIIRNYDIVYLNSSSLCFYGLFGKLVKPKLKIIMHIREPLLPSLFGRIIRWVSNLSVDHYIAISQNELRDMRTTLPARVVYNYSDSALYYPQKGRSLHRALHGEGFFHVGYFARIESKNGIDDFIEVAARLAHIVKIKFNVYGCDARQLEEFKAKYSECFNLYFFPMVNDVPANLGDLDLLLVPFTAPHFSRSVVEAALMGVPSVAYDIESVNEVIRHGETGLLVPQRDIAAMASAVQALYEEPTACAKLGTAAIKFGGERFTERNFEDIHVVVSSFKSSGS